MVEYEISDNIVTVVVGIDGSVPPRELQLSLSSEISRVVNENLGFNYTRDSVTLTVDEYPGDERRFELGGATQYILMIDVNIGEKELTRNLINGVHNEIVEMIDGLGFIVAGSETIT